MKVDYFFSNDMFLTYNALRDIFKDLDKQEHSQVTDYILTKYNFLSQESLETLYGGLGNLFTAIDSNAGSEFELDDEYGDHSCYRTMLDFVRKLGYFGKKLNFESHTGKEVDNLFHLIRSTTKVSPYNIDKFLHRNN